MGVIKSGASTDLLTVDRVARSARISRYDTLGSVREGKHAYRVSKDGTPATPNSAVLFFLLVGSPNKTLLVHQISISGFFAGLLAAPVYASVVLEKWSTPPTGGSFTEQVIVPVSKDAPQSAARVVAFSAVTTEGTLVGTLGTRRVLIQNALSATAPVDAAVFDLRGQERSGVSLRGVSQCLSLA